MVQGDTTRGPAGEKEHGRVPEGVRSPAIARRREKQGVFREAEKTVPAENRVPLESCETMKKL